MSAFSNYLESALLNATLRGQNYTPPEGLYLALFTTDPTDDDAGAELTPASFPGYARMEILGDGTGFTAPEQQSDGSTRCTNASIVEFPLAVSDWPSAVAYFGLYDSASGGNLLFYGVVTPARTLIAGDNIRFPVGALRISLD